MISVSEYEDNRIAPDIFVEDEESSPVTVEDGNTEETEEHDKFWDLSGGDDTWAVPDYHGDSPVYMGDNLSPTQQLTWFFGYLEHFSDIGTIQDWHSRMMRTLDPHEFPKNMDKKTRKYLIDSYYRIHKILNNPELGELQKRVNRCYDEIEDYCDEHDINCHE